MIVDSSAILAIAFNEPDFSLFVDALAAATGSTISAVNFVEAAVRVDQTKSALLIAAFENIVADAALVVVPATPIHAQLAREAYRRFGKGNHRARLNFGDCFAYALAKETGEPLLFKGGDFAKTDVSSAL
jgi:ribonuclease VapC